MSALYFLSDVHLGAEGRDRERIKQRRLLAVLERARLEASALFIVGDLFDFWFEYGSVLPRGHHRVLTALENLAEAGVRITYLAGNHDFAIGAFFEKELGITVLRNDLDFSHEGTRFALYHGDGLAPKDGPYRLLKSVLRNRAAQWCFRWLHPDLGFSLARVTSHTSRTYTSTVKKYGPVDGMKRDAERRIGEGADVVVMGHRHIPAMERLGSGLYVNLGDWITHFTYAVWENGAMRLMTVRNDIIQPFEEA